MPRQLVTLKDHPAPLDGNNQPAYRAGDFVFIGGTGPFDEHHHVIGKTIEEQTRDVLEKIKEILEASNATFSDVVKTTCLINDIGNNFVGFNTVYREYFPEPRPARATVGSRMDHVPGMLIIIEAIAYTGK